MINLEQASPGPDGRSRPLALRAGPWIFATGLMAGKATNAAAALQESFPVPAQPSAQREAALVFDLLETALRKAGADLSRVVRLDQYYPTASAVDPYHVERRKRFGAYIAPSTSMLVRRLSAPAASLEVQAIGVAGDAPFNVTPLDDPALRAPATSGFAPAVIAGDLAFIPGLVASASPGTPARRGLAEAARLPEGTLWKGTPIGLETRHLLEQRLAPSLKLAGASPGGVLKAQAYLTHAEDLGGFLQAWQSFFGSDGPALTVAPMPDPSIGVEDARLEINFIALRDGASTSARRIAAPITTAFAGVPAAVHAADLLFISGLYPLDSHGLVGTHPHDPAPVVQYQAAAIATTARAICAAAGADLSHLVRSQLFLSDICDRSAVEQVWRDLGMPDVPTSCIETANPMLFPGCRVMADLWVHAP
jgi:enamine deaminase RidA (YjgF/YER057c/UK114 family)